MPPPFRLTRSAPQGAFSSGSRPQAGSPAVPAAGPAFASPAHDQHPAPATVQVVRRCADWCGTCREYAQAYSALRRPAVPTSASTGRCRGRRRTARRSRRRLPTVLLNRCRWPAGVHGVRCCRISRRWNGWCRTPPACARWPINGETATQYAPAGSVGTASAPEAFAGLSLAAKRPAFGVLHPERRLGRSGDDALALRVARGLARQALLRARRLSARPPARRPSRQDIAFGMWMKAVRPCATITRKASASNLTEGAPTNSPIGLAANSMTSDRCHDGGYHQLGWLSTTAGRR